MIWGRYTWMLFHTLAEKIKDEYFNDYKKIVFSIIYSLCSCLPCPTCKQHAMETLKKKNIFNVETKEGLKMFLYQFHNTVSYTKGSQVYDIHILDQYELSNLKQIIPLFKVHFSTNVPGLMSEQLKRRYVVSKCLNLIKEHNFIFNV